MPPKMVGVAISIFLPPACKRKKDVRRLSKELKSHTHTPPHTHTPHTYVHTHYTTIFFPPVCNI